MTAWVLGEKRLSGFLCVLTILMAFFVVLFTPLTQKNKQDKFEDSLSCLRLSYNLSE